MLGPMLAVPAVTIDGILAGEAVKYSPRWRAGHFVLAQNLDLPALYRDLRNLEAYLAWEEVATRNAALAEQCGCKVSIVLTSEAKYGKV